MRKLLFFSLLIVCFFFFLIFWKTKFVSFLPLMLASLVHAWNISICADRWIRSGRQTVNDFVKIGLFKGRKRREEKWRVTDCRRRVTGLFLSSRTVTSLLFFLSFSLTKYKSFGGAILAEKLKSVGYPWHKRNVQCYLTRNYLRVFRRSHSTERYKRKLWNGKFYHRICPPHPRLFTLQDFDLYKSKLIVRWLHFITFNSCIQWFFLCCALLII